MKKLIVLAISVLLISGYFFLFSPLPFVPKIGRGLPSNFAEAESIFEKRVKEKYRLGVSKIEVVESLREQGFEITEDENTGRASFRKSRFTCELVWNISWVANNEGNLDEISSSYGGICL